MAYGEEESVDSDVYKLFVGLALSFYQMGSFNAVIAKKTKGVVLKEYLDVLGCLNALLHHLRRTEKRLAHNEIYLLCQS